MCGIFGAVSAPDDSLLDVNVDAALASILHRGPDGSGVVRGPGWLLGHRRLAVLDLTESGAQPMSSRDRQVTVTFNGEIYNHHQLRRELLAQGHRFSSRSDTEVIVEGYRAWGASVVPRLDGMFALGIWDSRRQSLLLARDRAGKKPLFYARRGRQLRFASEIKAILASGLRPEIDEHALPYLLALGYVPAPWSLIRGVDQLQPASTLRLERGGQPVVERYWRAPFAGPSLRVTGSEARATVRRLVEEAVERRLEADVPLGAFLSGGIDSTIVVGIMARKLGRKVRTFSIGFAGDARYDETAYAKIAARAFQTDHTEFVVEPSSFDLIERLVKAYDGPFGDASAVPTAIVSMLTRRSVTVALTGDGGDELFCGYPRFLAAEFMEHVPRLARRATGRVLSRFRKPTTNNQRPLARAHRLLYVASQPLADRLLGWISLFDVQEVLRPELRRSLDVEAPRKWSRAICDDFADGPVLARALAHNFESYLAEDLLVKADRCSMAYSLELRSPFLDTALIEYAARLPARLLRHGATTKWILRNAFADLLPLEIQRRSKMGFGVPLGAWFRGPLREYVRDLLAPGARCFEFVDPRYVESLLLSHQEGAADHGLLLWLLLTLEVWLRSLRRD